MNEFHRKLRESEAQCADTTKELNQCNEELAQNVIRDLEQNRLSELCASVVEDRDKQIAELQGDIKHCSRSRDHV